MTEQGASPSAQSDARLMPMIGSYSRPIEQMTEAREHLIHHPSRVSDAIRVLEGAILDLGGPKLWGAAAVTAMSDRRNRIVRSECPEHGNTLSDVDERMRRWCSVCATWVEPVTAEYVRKRGA